MSHHPHICQNEKCSDWGAFGERLPDVPEFIFPTYWYCRAHLPADYFKPTARDRLRQDYRANYRVSGPVLKIPVFPSVQGRLF